MGGGVGRSVGGLIGAVVGSYFGPVGAMIGSAIGGYAGGQADMALADPVQGPRLGDVQVSTSTYGLPIPKGWGVVRLPGQLIWTNGIKENANEDSGKGKGMKGPSQIQFTYTASFAFAFALGPADKVLKIYADGKPVYDATDPDNAANASNILLSAFSGAAFNFRFYGGTEEQLPDPLIAESVGADRCPAFRGLVYICCEDVLLTPYGNRIPTISAEIAFQASGGAVTTLLQELPRGTEGALPVGYAYQSDQGAYDGVRGIVYRTSGNYLGGAGPNLFAENYVVFEYALPMRQSVAVPLSTLYGDMLLDVPGPDANGFQPQITQMGAAEGSLLYLSLRGGSIGSGSLLVGVDPVSQRVVCQWPVPDGVTRIAVARLLTPEGVYDLPVLTFAFAAPMVFSGPLTTLNGVASNLLFPITTFATPPFAYTGAYAATTAIEGRRRLGSTEVWFVNWKDSGADWSPTVDLWPLILAMTGVTAGAPRSLTYAEVFTPEQGHSMTLTHAAFDRANEAMILHLNSDGQASGGNVPVTYKVVSLGVDGTLNWQTTVQSNPVSFPATMGNSRLLGTTYAFVGGTQLYQIDLRSGAILTQEPIPSSATYPDGTPGGPATPLYNQAFDSLTGFIWNQGATAYQRFYLDAAQGGTVPLSVVVSDLCLACGLTADDIDVTQLASDLVRGFFVTVEPGRDAIGQLGTFYLFDSVESDDKLRFVKRGGPVRGAVPYLKVLPGEDGVALRPKRTQPYELPSRATLRAPDPGNSYQQGTQQYARVTGPASVKVVDSRSELAVDTNLVLTADEARSMAKRLLLIAWQERTTFNQVGLPPEFLRLEPTDVVEIGLPDGENLARVRLSRVDIGADYTLQVSGVTEDETLLAVTAPGDPGSGGLVPALPTPYAVQPMLFDLPLLRDGDDSGGTALRLYLAASTYPGQVFSGAQYLVSGSPVADFSALGPALRAGAAWGTAVNALGDWPDAGITDQRNSLTVAMAQGGAQLVSATPEQVLNGANAAALVNAAGEAEILQFETVTPLGGDRYSLTGLLRGRRGSEWAMGRHAAGDRFLLLTEAALRLAALDGGALNSPRYVKAMGLFDRFDATTAYPVTFRGAAEKPYAPSHLEGAWNEADDLTITWIRRTRYGGEWVDGTESVPLAEQHEEYVLEVLGGDGTVLRTMSGLTAPTATYTAAQQTADGLTPGDPVTVRVYQVSALVGRGYAATETLDPAGDLAEGGTGEPAPDPGSGPVGPPPPPTPPASSLLFHGDFSGATLNPPSGDFSTLTGTDDTGYTWDDAFWGGNWGVHHYNYSNASAIISTTGPTGGTVKAIRLKVVNGFDSQSQETMMLNPATGSQGPLYVRFWARLGEDVQAQLQNGGPWPGGIYKDWRGIWEIKSGDPTGGNAGMGDLRIGLGFRKVGGVSKWRMSVDTNANYSPQSEVPYVMLFDQSFDAPVPGANEWFLVECWVDRGTPGADNGVWWVKINGAPLYTYTGRLWGIKNKPWNRLMWVTYTNASYPHAMDVTDIQIASAPP